MFVAWAGLALADGWPKIFDPYKPVMIYLEMAVEDWDRVRFDQPSQSEDWIPEVAQAWFRGEGEEPMRVAVRRKGESDLALPSSEDPRKVSLKIDINEYVPGQTWHDLKKLSLENGSTAPLREGFAWVIHRQAEPFYGYKAALSGWVRLFINGEEVGVFTSTEQRDEAFLRNHDLYSPTCTWLYKVDGTTELEVGVSNSPAYLNLNFSPFNSGPSGKPPSSGGEIPDLDSYLPQWVNMRGMLTLAACNAFTENTDSLFTHAGKNTFCVDFFPSHPRTRRYYPWDLDTGISQGTASIYGTTVYQKAILDHPWYGRVYEHILRELLDGPLAVEALTNVLKKIEAELAIPLAADPYVYSGGTDGEFAALRAWVVKRNTSIRSQFRHTYVPRPLLSHPGGEVAPGFQLTLSAPGGTVYYTLDGTDPRAAGGAPSVSAAIWEMPLQIAEPLHITARTLIGTQWSGLATEATFTVARHGSALRVTEIMYNPLDVNLTDGVDNDGYEFIEFCNTGAEDLDLSLFYCEGITFTFPVGFTVAAGGFVVLVRNPSAFAERYPGVGYAGVYLGKLSNAGEKIRVLRPDGTTVVSVQYDDDPPWVIAPDGMGYSLVNMNVDGDPDNAANWRSSTALFGSPAAQDAAPPYSNAVVFNEILSHTDPPLEDAIELHNMSDEPAAVGGWFLSDSARNAQDELDATLLRKYRIPDGSVIPPRGFKVFYAKDFNGSSALSPFGLSEFGEKIYLSAADSAGNLLGHVVALDFPALENGISFGRIMTSAGPVYDALAARTFGVDDPGSLPEFRTGTGATNAAPRVGPVVINEIMYHPPAALTEFIELHNITDLPVDVSLWKLNGAGGFTFPAGVAIPAGGFALLIETNLVSVEAFRLSQEVPDGCAIYGSSFVLDNGGERLTLQKPNTSPLEPMYTVESVRYNDKPPWPTEADGSGPSLERYESALSGSEPLNWRTSRTGGSPGRTNLFNSGLAVTAGSNWKYRAGPSSLATAWREPGYADTIWPDGAAPLGYGEAGLATVITYGTDPANKYTTTYFRKVFSLAEDPATLTRLTLEAVYDDGFVAYLNGIEVTRRSMPAGEVDYATLAEDHESGPFEIIELGAEGIALLRQGVNVLAVELHQANTASEDLVWDARITYRTDAMNPATDPVCTPGSGRFIDPLAVALASATEGAEIRYTLDGGTPDERSPLYSAPLVFVSSTLLKARAFALGYTASGITSAVFERIEQDGDGDGLPDDWELTHFGSITLVNGVDDSDNDGVTNADEYICGTDPNDGSSIPVLFTARENNALYVRFLTVQTDRDTLAYRNQERCYSLQSAASLAGDDALWSDVSTMSGILGNGLIHEYGVPAGRPREFYKLRIWLTTP